MELLLTRVYYPRGCNGAIYLNKVKICNTIELPWKNNQRQISCIPEGTYELKKRHTARFGDHLILLNVPNRSYILLHAANDAMKEIKGCIATVTVLTGQGRGDHARMALAKLVAAVYPAFEKEKVFLTIKSVKDE